MIELVITVGIVGLLVAVAVPAWGSMMAKGRQAEARNNLAAINALETVFRQEEGRFGDLVEIGFVAEGTGYYGYLISTEDDGGYVGPNAGGMDYGGQRGGGFEPGDDDDDDAPTPDDDDDDGGNNRNNYRRNRNNYGPMPQPTPGNRPPPRDREEEAGGGAPYGNPHFDADSFEAVAFGRISSAPPPRDVDVWSMDQTGWLENLSPGY